MKSFMILGAVVGFLIGAGFSLANNSSWPTAFWRASAAALAVAILTRWWSRVWLQNLQDAVLKHRRGARLAPAANHKSAPKV